MSAYTQDASGAQDMGELLESVEPLRPLRRGDVVDGIVMRSDPEGVLVNIGHKAEGLIPPMEMKTLDREAQGQLKIGDEITALVVRGESSEGAAILSIDRAVGEMGWRVLEKALEAGDRVSGRILGFNRGGAIVEVEGIQGFVPISQLVSVSRDQFRGLRDTRQPGAPTDDDQAKENGDEPDGPSDIDKILELKVLEVNRGRNRAILSERQVVQELREESKARLIEELSEGEVRRGRVTGISSFGAFVDLGGADGLVHVSELSWSPVNSPSEVVKIGDELDVYVLRVDAENKKIALSIKRLQQEPWETINDRFQVGDLVDATVTKLTDFGAFARLEDSVEGLIHISELSSRAINHPSEVVSERQVVRLKILRIEPERRRLGLSLRQAAEEEPEDDIQAVKESEGDIQAAEKPEDDIQAVKESEGDIQAAEEPEDDIQAVMESEGDIQAAEEPEDDIQAVKESEGDIQAAEEPEDDIQAVKESEGDIQAAERNLRATSRQPRNLRATSRP